MSDEPTPAEVRTLAASADMLAAEIDLIRAKFARSSDPIRLTGFRLDSIGGELRRASQELGNTASDLVRSRNARDPNLCHAEWGVCPEHGNTLTSTGSRSRCTVCGRGWDYDRAGLPCGEPLTHTVTDPQGGRIRMCTGHAIAAAPMPGWSTQPDDPT
jgi:hypothetical protein